MIQPQQLTIKGYSNFNRVNYSDHYVAIIRSINK